MSSPAQAQTLKAGEHYGSIFCKCSVPSAYISESVYQKSLRMPEHSHELGFFTLILDGSYSEEVRRRDVVYTPQTVLWRQAEISHKDKIEADNSRFFFVEIDKSFSEKLLPHGSVPERLAESNGSLTWLSLRLRDEILRGSGYSPLIAEGIVFEMLGTLMRQGKTIGTRPPKWLTRTIEKLNEEFAEKIANEVLATDAGVHPVYMASAFRRFYGETIGDYVQKLRVAHAATLLRKTGTSLSEIAFSCGFADQSHFTRIFKRRFGITPGAYRSSLDIN